MIRITAIFDQQAPSIAARLTEGKDKSLNSMRLLIYTLFPWTSD